MPELTHCLNCHKEIEKYSCFVDRTGQFPKLNLKAIEMGKQDVEICYECYEDLSGETSKSRQSGSDTTSSSAGYHSL